MENIFVIFVIFLFILINVANRRILGSDYRVINPLSVYIYLWTIILIGHRVYYPISEYTALLYVLVFLGAIGFAIGFWLFKRMSSKNIQKSLLISYDFTMMSRIMKLFTFLCILRTLLAMYIVFKLAGSLDVFINNNTYVRLLYLARKSSTVQVIVQTFLNLNAYFGYAILGIYVANKGEKSKSYLVLWAILEFVFAYVTMSKMSLVIFIVVLCSSYINNVGKLKVQKRVIRRLLPVIAVLLFVFLLIIGNQRNYTQFGTSLVEVVFSKLISYFVGPLEGMRTFFSIYDSELAMGRESFSFIFNILARVGVLPNYDVIKHADSIKIYGGSINVFTWFKAFYIDFSYLGFVVGPFIVGSIAGYLYRPKLKNYFYSTAWSWIIAVVFMSFYSYLLSQSIYIVLLFYVYFIHKLFYNKLYVMRKEKIE